MITTRVVGGGATHHSFAHVIFFVMEVEFVSTTVLKRLVESISELASEVQFEFSPDAMSVNTMDGAHVALVVVYLNRSDRSCFSKYRVRRNITLGINMASLKIALNFGDADCSATLKMNDVDDDSLAILFRNSEKPASNATFNLHLVTIECEKLNIPSTAYPAIVTMPASNFRIAINKLQTVGNVTDLSISENQMVFKTKGDFGTVNTALASDSGVDIKLAEDVAGSVTVQLALRYLSIFSKASSMASAVRISVDPGLPAEIYFVLNKLGGRAGDDDGADQCHSYISFYLAPKEDDKDAS